MVLFNEEWKLHYLCNIAMHLSDFGSQGLICARMHLFLGYSQTMWQIVYAYTIVPAWIQAFDEYRYLNSIH